MKDKGLIQVYTGNGKGKTTAAVGLACRAIGHNLRVGYIYFHKVPEIWGYGEHKILQKLGVEIFGFAKEHPQFFKNFSSDTLRDECLSALELIEKIYQENRYDMLILDEINIAVRDGFLKEDEVLKLLDTKPEKMELILTGRLATEKIIKKADLVSKIMEIKHPYKLGIKGRVGIEY